MSLGGIFAFPLSDSAAGGLHLTAGARKSELLFNAGFQLDEAQRLILTLGQQRQHLDINFRSGAEKTAMTQHNGAVSYQFRMERGLLNSAELNGYLAVTPSRNLADKTYAVDTAALYELWNDPRRVAGGRVTGLQGRLVFAPLPGGTFKLGAGGERQEYDLLTGKQSTTRATGSAEWSQQLAGGYRIKAGADAAAQNRYTLGLEHSLESGGLFGASFTGIRGKNGAPNDNQLKLTWRYDLDGKRTASGNNSNNSAAQTWGSLLDQVAQRPSFLPAQVVAKLDTSAAPLRLIAVNKAALPAGASVNTVTGAITTPLGIAAAGIAGVTLNAAPFVNTGQFALSGNSLIIDPNQITQPAVGVTDTYVVTVNIFGGGTSLVTVVVSRGSVRIDSIALANNAAPTANNFTYGTNIDNTAKTFDWKVLSAAADADGDTLTATVQAQGAKGTFVVAGNNVTYTPSANQTVSDSGTLRISDGRGGVKDITVTVNGIDTAPPAAPSGMTIDAGAATTTNTAISLNVADVVDPSGVEWFVSESGSAPAAGDAGWVGTKPTNYTFATAANETKTVCVYVKDTLGNVQPTGACDTIVKVP